MEKIRSFLKIYGDFIIFGVRLIGALLSSQFWSVVVKLLGG